ncbi:MAG: hypothetical protein VX278_05755 [Myxococcota bacterium]|nr:hypothetical protein [Myxococcota bacterium]
MKLLIFLASLPTHAFHPSTCNKESKCPTGATECICDDNGRLLRIYTEQKNPKGQLLFQKWETREKHTMPFTYKQIDYTRDASGRLLELHHESSNKPCTRHDQIEYISARKSLRTFDLNGNGTVDRRVQTLRDSSNAIIETKTDRNGDGDFDVKCIFQPPCNKKIAQCRRPKCVDLPLEK